MPPKGATGDGGFKATPDMMSILGCSAAELGNVLKALGFRLDRRRVAPDQQSEPPAAVMAAATAAAAAEGPAICAEGGASAACRSDGGGGPAAGVEEDATITPIDAPAAIAPTPDADAAMAASTPLAAAEEIWEEIWATKTARARPG